MSEAGLLRIIREEAAKSTSNFADGETVKRRYGEQFEETFRQLVERGYISFLRAPTGSITLSPAGLAAVRRLG